MKFVAACLAALAATATAQTAQWAGCREVNVSSANVKAEFTVANGGGTRQEFPPNLVKSGTENWNKWYENTSSASWVSVTTSDVIAIDAFGFVSANDVPARDPKAVSINVVHRDGVTESLGKFGLSYNGLRWNNNFVELDQTVYSNQFRFTFVNDPSVREIQLGQIKFYDCGRQAASVDQIKRVELSATSSVVASHSVNGGGTGKEFPPNILKSGEEPWNKWYESTSNTATITIKNTAGITFSGFGFKSANDVPNRDPDTVRVEVIQNGQAVLLDNYALSWDQRWQTRKYVTDKRYFASEVRFTFNNTKAHEIQLGEIIFLN